MRVAYLLAASLLTSICAFSQATSTSGDIRGTIVDPSGNSLPNAKLTVLNQDRAFSRSSLSNGEGRFAIPSIPPGIYKLRAEADGFTSKLIENIEVRVGDVISLMVQLPISTLQTEVVVTADIGSVEVERTQQANTIEQSRINNLPINRRSYLDFALLAPGVVETTSLVDDSSYRPIQTPNSGLSFGGSNGRGNGFFIDGLENFSNAGGGVRPSISQEAAQEFQINRNSFSAEFGNALGGIVNVISKSGSNQLHGNAFGFLRHQSIQARNYFDPGKSSFTRAQAGATLGGAIKKDKTFFFAAYELLARQETNFIPILQDRGVFSRITGSQDELFRFFEASGDPTLRGLAAQGRVLLQPRSSAFLTNLFNANSGTFPFSQLLNTVSLRLDHKFSERNSGFFRSNTTLDRQDNTSFGALDGFNRGRQLNLSDSTVAIGDTWSPNANWVVETRAMFGYDRFDVYPVDKNGPEININGSGFFGRQIFLPGSNFERHYQALVNVTRSSARHTLKFGYDF
ncbi:MAG: carboxypeptidase-like regulatory domain-containing protein, partial [Acidobacteria bacterium]|nr:carboxypeptidase-like regulatory domain-containing protein [Acidobacteriota bacterium]